MSEWQPIETAPKDGTPFIALNSDLEVWVSRFDQYGRITYRTNERYEPRRFIVHQLDGKELLEEDKSFAAANEEWRSNWTLWSRLYEFSPTHWMPLPAPPRETRDE